MTPRPQNRSRKTGKLTPGKNPGTLGSAGRSDPARDACGRPRAFHLLFFHTFHHFWFLGKHSPGGKVESWRILRLRWRLFSGLGCSLFFLPNSALCGPNRPLTGLGRGVPPPGVETATRGLLGAKRGPWVVLWGGWLWVVSPVPEGTQGTQNSARGGTGLMSLARAFQRVQGGNAYQCTLLLTHNM